MNFAKAITAWGSFYLKRYFYLLLGSCIVSENKLYKSILSKRSLEKILRFEKNQKNSFVYPIDVEVELTNFCNFDCVFCPNSAQTRVKSVMEYSTFTKIVDDINRLGIKHLILSGFGESLLDKNFINKMVYLSNNKIDFVELVTNGYALNGNLSNFLAERDVIDKINISIDAADERVFKEIHRKNGFETVFNNLLYLHEEKKRCNKKFPLISVRFKDFYANKGEFGKFLRKFRNIVDEIKTYVNIFNWPGAEGSANSSRQVKKLFKIVCPNVWQGMRINCNGDVVLCCMDYEGSIVLGNIINDSLENIWNGEKIRFYRKLHKEFNFECLPLCKDCNINTCLVMPW